MCDKHTLQREAEVRKSVPSRRDFLQASAAAVALLPVFGCGGNRPVATLGTKESRVEIKTADGVADGYFVSPASGRHPGILMWPDFMSLRPTYEMLAKRLAESGYAVLVVNQYYRSAKAPIIERVDFDDKVVMTKIKVLASELNADTTTTDARACIAFLDAHPSVDSLRKIGTMGYCMGGRFAVVTAAAVPERVGAIAAFHAGGLVSSEPDSPHLLIPKLKARSLIAIAADDDEKEPETKNVLRTAFANANLTTEIEVYSDTRHGWCTPDMSASYNAEQAQRAWARMLTTFEQTLAKN
jgi:carboxymethylenebutenolidase